MIACPAPAVASIGRKSARSESFGSIFSIPSNVIMVFGKAAVRRALPSFSVIETMPVSAMAKFAPVIPMSAVRYFFRNARRAIIVNSSGLSVGALPSSR